MRRAGTFALLLLTAPVLVAAAVELYGKPLRGLTPVPIAEIAAHPERYRDRSVRVTGEATETEGGRIVLSEGGASLALETDGGFALPPRLAGARVTAEGKVRAGEPALLASGLEARR